MNEYYKYLPNFDDFVSLTEDQKSILSLALKVAYIDWQLQGMRDAREVFAPRSF